MSNGFYEKRRAIRSQLPKTLAALDKKVGPRHALFLALLTGSYGYDVYSEPEIARREGISAQRVNQIVARGLEKLGAK